MNCISCASGRSDKSLSGLAGLLLLALAGCATLPPSTPRQPSQALPPSTSGTLAQIDEQLRSKLTKDQSAFTLIPGNREAMNWRLAMIDSATSSIDAQYFIWQDDEASSLLLEHVFAAADRGVRVRLLVDDMFFATGGLFSNADKPIAAINLHPNIEVRLFNPGRFRSGLFGVAGNFGSNSKEYNRRMHNKLMVFDNRWAIVGGRNIGNAYFGLSQQYNFLDLDVLFAGAVVNEASAAFDEYWNTKLAYPGAALTQVDKHDLDALRRENRGYVEQHADILRAFPLEPIDWSQRLQTLPQQIHTGYAVFLQDKAVQHGTDVLRLYDMLELIIGTDNREFLTVTPYLIPVGNFLETIKKDHDAGIKTRLITASMGSNNHTAAHSHYRKYRKRILATGAELYELRRQPAEDLRALTDVSPRRASFVALHIKAGVVDQERCFMGSLNLDPRAVVINTENGIYVESPGLCKELHDHLARLIEPENAWRVSQNNDDDLRWTSSEGTVSRQPARSFGQRIADFFLGLLPIESQL